ncbi:hypothetical protein ACH9L7_14785 [Haloferax sp. S1W]|uniref:hypothetical protein n=1 Tax=Haloferax sp. S1W TaxID=3377110 RepID=UPI0037CA971E
MRASTSAWPKALATKPDETVTLRTFLGLTVVAHAVLAWLVRLNARKRGDDATGWVAITLFTGVFGVAGYVLRGR